MWGAWEELLGIAGIPVLAVGGSCAHNGITLGLVKLFL